MLALAILGVAVLTIAAAVWAGILPHSRLAAMWRGNAGGLLAVYLLLSLVAVAVITIAHPAASCSATAKCYVPNEHQPFGLPVVAFLTWRVSRGGKVSRILLIIWSGLGYAAVATSIARVWSVPALSLLVIYAVQIGLLTSPAVYRRTRPDGGPAPEPGAQRAWPPLWLVLAGLLPGLVVTLLYLSNMQEAALPGCGPAGATLAHLPGRCIGLVRGYPLRFLTADQNTPLIDKAALIKDWAQWSLVSFSVLYPIWLRHEPAPPAAKPSPARPGQQPLPE